jgi:ankyrin repeat protein
LLLDTDNDGMTVWHWAAERCNLEFLHKMWEWADYKLTTEEVYKLLLGTDNDGMTACHWAAESCNLEVLHKI